MSHSNRRNGDRASACFSGTPKRFKEQDAKASAKARVAEVADGSNVNPGTAQPVSTKRTIAWTHSRPIVSLGAILFWHLSRKAAGVNAEIDERVDYDHANERGDYG
jgi:hypothetical protein